MGRKYYLVTCSEEYGSNPRIWTNRGWVGGGVFDTEVKALALTSEEAIYVRDNTEAFSPFSPINIKIVPIVFSQVQEEGE